MSGGRDEWMRARLDNWARWLVERGHAGLGFPRQASYCRLVPCSVSTDSGRIPIDDCEAQATHAAVEALRFEAPHLHLAVHCRWVGDPRVPQIHRRPLSVAETCGAMCIQPATVYAHIKRAQQAIRAHLSRAKKEF